MRRTPTPSARFRVRAVRRPSADRPHHNVRRSSAGRSTCRRPPLRSPRSSGPSLTLVLRRAPAVDLAITGGQDTVPFACRSPVALQLLRAFGSGIAAPSQRYAHQPDAPGARARRIGRPEDRARRRDCKIGLESTIVSCVDTCAHPATVRSRDAAAHGGAGLQAGPTRVRPCPGSDAKHYAPARRSASSRAARSRKSWDSSPSTARKSPCLHAPAARGQQVHDVDQRRPPPTSTSRAVREPAHAGQGGREGNLSRKCPRRSLGCRARSTAPCGLGRTSFPGPGIAALRADLARTEPA